MENTLTKSKIEEGLKNLSRTHKVSHDALQKTFYFLRDAKKEIDKSPMVSLSSLVIKHGVSRTWITVLYDKAVENPKDKPKTYKVWSAGEVTPRLAFNIYNYKKKVANQLNKGTKSKAGTKIKDANTIGNLLGIDSGRYSFAVKSYINAAVEDYPDAEFMEHKILAYFNQVKDMVDTDSTIALTPILKEYGLMASYSKYMKSFGILENRGTSMKPEYFWVGPKPDMVMAKKAYKYSKKLQKQQREKNLEKKNKLKAKSQQEQQEAEQKAKLQETVAEKVNQLANDKTAENLKERLPDDATMAKAIEKTKEVTEKVKTEEPETAQVIVEPEQIGRRSPQRKGNLWEVEDVDPSFIFKVKPTHTEETKKIKLFGLTVWSVTKTKQIK